ncbi:hypothetical protein [Mycolicibacterium chlorophenolicum]|uniref:Uncharacterized protein n=1 Tax=Mycolicibacterium chlorophenolicum TaxID=37916 RepID=A0A0J6V9R9_9MYCO|nr:hypothetical protein [Mycolicibacterium chlorophenolicum]KMO66964.1 hypothetical protein MCHLDSM_07308 [Mycolicibacterium chlorophenolicum]
MSNSQITPTDRMSQAGVLLTGSVPLYSTEEVIKYCGGGLGDVAVGIPDGEVGDRSMWIIYQAYRVLDGHPQLATIQRPQPDYNWRPSGFDDFWLFAVRDGETLHLDDIGYARTAAESYDTFRELKAAGIVPSSARFQVSLPLPESAASWFFPNPEHLRQAIDAYTTALQRELAAVLDTVPHDQLTIQWDTCWEILDVEEAAPWTLPGGEPPLERFRAMCARMSSAIPPEVLLGYHLCYGDLGHKHMKNPENLAVSVTMSNVAAESSGRPVDFVHMAVPADRADDAYFAPLQFLRPGPKPFLGLVHEHDGLEGGVLRWDAAAKFRQDFGIATECGWGRRPAWQVPALIKLHRQILEARAG